MSAFRVKIEPCDEGAVGTQSLRPGQTHELDMNKSWEFHVQLTGSNAANKQAQFTSILRLCMLINAADATVASAAAAIPAAIDGAHDFL